MSFLILAFGGLLAGVVTALLVPVARRLAYEYGWVDRPDKIRKQHAEATPNIGGVTIVAGATVGIGYLLTFTDVHGLGVEFPSGIVWAGAIAMVVTGFYDDTRGLSFKGKFFAQILVAYFLVCAGFSIDLAGLPFVEADPYQHAVYSVPLTMLWIVGVINAVNLLDGLDGLAAGVAAIAFASLAMVFGLRGEVALAVAALPIIGALLGFLWHNFNPASIFMGDSGSLFLGYMLAVYSLQGHAHSDAALGIVIPIVALGLPILDTGLSIVRRISTRKAICAPDADHIHHRLLRMHASVRRVVLILYAVAGAFGAIAVLMAFSAPAYAYALLVSGMVLIPLGLRKLGYAPIRDFLNTRITPVPTSARRVLSEAPHLPRHNREHRSHSEQEMPGAVGHASEQAHSAYAGDGELEERIVTVSVTDITN